MLYLRMLFSADGTAEYAKAIRWLYLFGYFGKEPQAEKKLNKLDNKNFKKWEKINQKDFEEYLKIARV